MIYVRRRIWLLCTLAAAASLLVFDPFQTAEEPAASSLPDVEALRSPCSPKMTRRAPEAFRACFATSHGPFEAHCVRRRAPVWVDRVYNLVANGFYDDQRDRMLSVSRSTLTLTQLGAIAALASGRSPPEHPPTLHTAHGATTATLAPSPAPSKVGHLQSRPSHGVHLRAIFAPGTFRACSMAAVSPLCSSAPLVTPPSRAPHPNYSPSPDPNPTLTPALSPHPNLALALALAPNQATPPSRAPTTTAPPRRVAPSCSRSRTAWRTAMRRGLVLVCTG